MQREPNTFARVAFICFPRLLGITKDQRIPGELFPGRKYLQPGQMRRRSTNRVIREHREEALASSFFPPPGLDGEFARRQEERNPGAVIAAVITHTCGFSFAPLAKTEEKLRLGS